MAVAGRIAQWLPEMDAAPWESLDETARAKASELFVGLVDEVVAERAWPRGCMALAAQGIKPASAEIILCDADIASMLRDAKARKLSPDWLRELPAHLDDPSAMPLDRTPSLPCDCCSMRRRAPRGRCGATGG